MKIAHIVSTYPPYWGGMGNVAFEMASGLERRGHEVDVFTPVYGEIPEEHGAEARRVRPAFALGNAAWMVGFHRELAGFDLVHLHYPFFGAGSSVRRWKARNPSKPLLITYHMDALSPGWKGLFFRAYARYWTPRILGAADRIIVSSFDYAASCQAKEFFRQNKSRLVELPFGVDMERFSPGKKSSELLARYELSSDAPIVLFVGGMDAAHAFKGVPVLLNALRLLKKEGFICQTLLVGDGDRRQGYADLARGLGVHDCARFAGRVSAEELPEHYRLADVLVLPSTSQSEAFGMVILEAFASGVPVVTSDLPGVRTVARNAGMIVPPNDPPGLAQGIRKALSRDWGALARRVAEERYGWDAIIDRLDWIYAEVAGSCR